MNDKTDTVVLETLLQIKEQLGGLYEKMDNLDESLHIHTADDKASLAHIEKRLSSLEDTKNRFLWTFGGAWSVVLAGAEILRIWFHMNSNG